MFTQRLGKLHNLERNLERKTVYAEIHKTNQFYIFKNQDSYSQIDQASTYKIPKKEVEILCVQKK